MQRTARKETSISQKLYFLLEKIGTSTQVMEGTHLFHEGTPAEYIYVVKSGLIQIGKMSKEGKELTLRLCQTGALIGELTLFSENATYFLNAKALKTSVVYTVSKTELEQELMDDSEMAIEYMKWSSDRMRVFQYKIRDLLLHGKKGALYSTLIRLANSYGTEHSDGIKINVALTDTELAAFAAATRESANRMMIDLRKRNVVSTLNSGKILIKNLQYLRDQIGCEDCPLVICHIN
ncbi:Crp/Fnr family transcriptional regulator [Virgibacillus sp. W0181]|uniref:Crp/Fnr family transcriptional regulator n=1 Tax=Virgibacillus sp. W0181 TaxID=3391581 RepID=UPI003F44821D